MLASDSFAAILIFALSAAFFYMAGAYHGGAEVFPRAVSGVMMLASAILFFKGLRQPSTVERFEPGAAGRVVGVIVLTILYMVAVGAIGFVTSSLVFVPVTAYWLGIRNYPMIGITTVVFVALVALLFRRLFQVPLPRELILTWF